MRNPVVIVAAIAASLAVSTAALAQSAADILQQLGLLGRWARDCGQPASGSNPHVFFERSSDPSGARYRLEMGARTLAVAVDRVRPLGAGRAAMHVGAEPQDTARVTYEITLTIERNRWRTVYSIGSNGQEFIKDGIVASTGQPNPWQNRCD